MMQTSHFFFRQCFRTYMVGDDGACRACRGRDAYNVRRLVILSNDKENECITQHETPNQPISLHNHKMHSCPGNNFLPLSLQLRSLSHFPENSKQTKISNFISHNFVGQDHFPRGKFPRESVGGTGLFLQQLGNQSMICLFLPFIDACYFLVPFTGTKLDFISF